MWLELITRGTAVKVVRLGLLGLGTVGGGTVNVLRRNQTAIHARAGQPIVIDSVLVRDKDKARICNTANIQVTTDAAAIIDNPRIDVVVELIGGTDTALSLVMRAIEQGKHVVTANKALIALHGNEIIQAAQRQGVMVAFEAAVAGGIPIIKAIREGLAANKIEWLAGIINGTGNYILSAMQHEKREFVDVLAEAQALGYAEADPSFDIEGIDVAHKLTILAAIAYGIPLNYDKVYVEGITHIEALDMQYAEELGFYIKPLGIAREVDGQIQLRVHPALIPQTSALAHVDGAKNAVLIQSDALGPSLYYGAGAGDEPTASAVIADIVDVARCLRADLAHRVPPLAFHHEHIKALPIQAMSELRSAYYLRLQVQDHAGVMAHVTQILAAHNISIEALLQKERAQQQGATVPIVIVTHEVNEGDMNQALAKLTALDDVEGEVVKIRLEQLDVA